jgi:prepilin-type N-terminal cleavage/methylation domain-containing protein
MLATHIPLNLHALAFEGRANAIRNAFRGGADVNARDLRGAGPLHWATAISHPSTHETLAVLLRRGADPDARDNDGLTPEDWSRQRGNVGAADLFMRWNRASAERRVAVSVARGFTLVELLMALFIVSLITCGVFAYFTCGSAAASVVLGQEQTTQIAQSAVGAYASRKDFSGLTTANALMEGWLTDANTKNAWGGSVSLASAADGSLLIEHPGVPAGACEVFVLAEVHGFDAIDVNGVRVAEHNNPNQVALASACEAPSSTIVFTQTH